MQLGIRSAHRGTALATEQHRREQESAAVLAGCRQSFPLSKHLLNHVEVRRVDDGGMMIRHFDLVPSERADVGDIGQLRTDASWLPQPALVQRLQPFFVQAVGDAAEGMSLDVLTEQPTHQLDVQRIAQL